MPCGGLLEYAFSTTSSFIPTQSLQAMGAMNRGLNLPSIQRIMNEFEKESATMDMKEEMMSEAVDDVMDDEVEDEEEEGPPRGKTRPTRAVAEPQRQAACSCAQLLHLGLGQLGCVLHLSTTHLHRSSPASYGMHSVLATEPVSSSSPVSDAARSQQRA